MTKIIFFLLCISSFLESNAYAKDPFCDPQVLAAQTFYEDTLVLALYTHKPVVPGHCLVITKRHIERFEELTDAEFLQIGQTLKKVDIAVKEVFGTSDYLILEKNGKAAFQSVPHVHFHYIPRKVGDDSLVLFAFNSIIANLKRPIPPKEMKEVTQKLSKAIYAEN